MSRFLNGNFELLEPYEGKLSSTVLRGEGGSNAADLLDNCRRERERERFLCRLINQKEKVEKKEALSPLYFQKLLQPFAVTIKIRLALCFSALCDG